MSSEPVSADVAAVNSQKLENAIRAFQSKKPVPEIDFTLYTMEDGTMASTKERIVKGIWSSSVNERMGLLIKMYRCYCNSDIYTI
jgi:hypothetical protein